MLPIAEVGRIRGLHESGMSVLAIHKKTGYARTTINRALAHVGGTRKRKGRETPRIAKRQEVLTKLASEVKVVNGRSLPKNSSITKLTAALKKKGIETSRSTVHRDMSATHDCVVRPLKPFDCEHSHAMRRALRERYGDTPGDLFVFSDEHFITTNDHTTKSQWIRKSLVGEEKELPIPRIRESRFNVPSVMIWAAIGVDYKSPLVFIDKRKDGDGKTLGMDAKRYVRTCLAKLVPTMPDGRIFMQDGARCHTAKHTLAYLERKGVDVLEGWPPYSPDLNPIENLWHYLDQKISEQVPQSLAELKKVAKSAWEDIPLDVINNFVLSFKGRFDTKIQ